MQDPKDRTACIESLRLNELGLDNEWLEARLKIWAYKYPELDVESSIYQILLEEKVKNKIRAADDRYGYAYKICIHLLSKLLVERRPVRNQKHLSYIGLQTYHTRPDDDPARKAEIKDYAAHLLRKSLLTPTLLEQAAKQTFLSDCAKHHNGKVNFYVAILLYLKVPRSTAYEAHNALKKNESVRRPN